MHSILHESLGFCPAEDYSDEHNDSRLWLHRRLDCRAGNRDAERILPGGLRRREVGRYEFASLALSFYEKVINVKADVAALLLFDLRHISTGRAAGAVASRTAEDTETRHTRKAVALACLFMVAPVERIVTV
jgi:hypothetical protein